MTEPWTRAELGALGEQLAVDHLAALGLRVIDRNWRCRYGELDVIAVEPDARVVVFVEVKTRTTDQFGGVAQAVTPQKVRRLRRLAGLWLAAQTAAGRRCGSTSSACASGVGRLRSSPTCRGWGDGAGAGVLGGGARGGRRDRRDRSRHHVGAARRASRRLARCRAAGVARPGARGDHQLRQQLADGAADAWRCRRRRCRRWGRSTTSRWRSRCCRRT